MKNSNIPPGKDEGSEEKKRRQDLLRKQARFGLSYLIVSLIGMWLFQEFIMGPMLIRESEIPYSEFKSRIASGQIVDVTLGQDRIVGTMKNLGATDVTSETVPFTTVAVPDGDPTLIQALDAAGVKYSVSEPPSPVGNLLLLMASRWH